MQFGLGYRHSVLCTS